MASASPSCDDATLDLRLATLHKAPMKRLLIIKIRICDSPAELCNCAQADRPNPMSLPHRAFE